MKQIKILAIGNSFSEDATHYLHQIAEADGIDTKVVNLYIGGCSLETHWHNIEADAKLYLYMRDGISAEKYVSIKDALQEEEWDFVITQQASHDSGLEETYYPYIHKLFAYIKELSPTAEVLLHETWAYETDSTHSCFVRYNHDQQEMYQSLSKAYRRAAAELGVRMIPCGDVVQYTRSKEPFIYGQGGMSLCRDGFHMHFIYGRYLLAATWYEVIFKNSILNNTYIPKTVFAPDAEVDIELLNVIKECVHKIIVGGFFMRDENCAYCMKGNLVAQFGYPCCELEHSIVYIFKEQSHKGRCIVASKHHVGEITDLSDDERNGYFSDIAKVAKALHKAFNPDKVNYGAYADTGKHLHFHLVPKYKDEIEWGTVFEMNSGKIKLTDEEYENLAEQVRNNL